MSGDLANLKDSEFEKIKSWGLDIDPFAAVKDFSTLKTKEDGSQKIKLKLMKFI